MRLPIETIREVGNREVVDKVPGEPDFTFTMERLDSRIELMAFLTGELGIGTAAASANAPGPADPVGTEYDWLDCSFVNIASPWKDPTTGSAGVIEAGHLVPGYYPTRLRYRFGVTDNATQEVELAGGVVLLREGRPGGAAGDRRRRTTAFATDDNTVIYRKGGARRHGPSATSSA